MKKVMAIILAAVSLLTMSLLGGCIFNTSYPTYEDGFFVYYRPRKSNVIEIVGLTELGHQQKVIVMPKTIAGYEYAIRDSRGFWRTDEADWGENNVLEKIYFEYDAIQWGGPYPNEKNGYTFHGFNALKKIIINNENGKGKWCYTYVQNNTNVADYETNKDIISTRKFFIGGTHIANVEFMYNYEGAPNLGYYWLDDIEDSETIEIIPPDPEREGYTFAGWYCEPECESEWDFNNPINKIALTTEEFYPEGYVTYIYAKWIVA